LKLLDQCLKLPFTSSAIAGVFGHIVLNGAGSTFAAPQAACENARAPYNAPARRATKPITRPPNRRASEPCFGALEALGKMPELLEEERRVAGGRAGG
jgi:hypothetical protein